MNQTFIRGAGFAAILGGIVNAYSDYLLQGGLIVRAAVNTYKHLPNAPYEMVYWGSIIGNAAIPLWLLGFFAVYKALEPMGPALAIPPILLLAYAFSLFPGYHGSYALYAAGFQADPDQLVLSPTGMSLTDQLHQFHSSIMTIIGPTVTIGSLWLAIMILSGRTRYARWMAVFVPLMAMPSQYLVEMLPAPYGGIVRPAWGTLIFTLFFALSLFVSWNTSDQNKDPAPEQN